MKKIFLSCVLALSFLIGHTSSAADKKSDSTQKHALFHVGIGFGMDYGGLGLKVEYLPVKYIGVFGGVGYNFFRPAISGGVLLRPLPDAKIQPIALAMYGYNGGINIAHQGNNLALYDLEDVSKNYYGFSTGIAGELKMGRNENRLYLAVLYPFRSKEFRDNYDKVKASPVVDLKSDLLPVTFSLGFTFPIRSGR